MQRPDAIIIGAGIIGLSLALELKRRGLHVLIIDKAEPGREASWAAGGMLADFPLEMPAALHPLAHASAQMYPEFIRDLEAQSDVRIDLRDQGTIVFREPTEHESPSITDSSDSPTSEGAPLNPSFGLGGDIPLHQLEPALSLSHIASNWTPLFLPERSVDPRQLTTAALTAAQRGIDFSTSDPVIAITVADGKAAGIRTENDHFTSNFVINCAGAWAGQIPLEKSAGATSTIKIPTRPVKGQMLCVTMPHKQLLRHVIRTPNVYLIPRSDGRLLIGATQEEAGFDKQTIPATLARLRDAANQLVPQLAAATVLEAWAGLRPRTPDALPILGATSLPGYFVAAGHFRDGILLAPITARVMAQVICGEQPELDLSPFAASRFES